MANFATLKAAINAVIKTNGNKEITGEVLNQVLNAMVTSLGANYQFAGVATPSTNPGTPDQNVFYMATEAGTYTNFNATVLPAGISILLWNGSWSHETFFEIDSVPTSGSDNLISSGAVFEKMKLDGGAYDVSAHNEGATFASLSALLNSDNLNTLIPVNVRHGGMSIKFVHSSDNKYVQFRYMSSSTDIADFTNVANWQGVDDEPTANSDNLVKSGGVVAKISELEDNIGNIINGNFVFTDLGTITDGILNSSGTIIAQQGYGTSDYIDISHCSSVKVLYGYPVMDAFIGVAFFDNDHQFIKGGKADGTQYNRGSARFIRVSYNKTYLPYIEGKSLLNNKVDSPNVSISTNGVYSKSNQYIGGVLDSTTGKVLPIGTTTFYCSPFIAVANCQSIKTINSYAALDAYCGVAVYDSAYNLLNKYAGDTTIDLTSVSNIAYIRFVLKADGQATIAAKQSLPLEQLLQEVLDNQKEYNKVVIVDKEGAGDYTTIMSAVNGTSDGDTILIMPGTYNEVVNMYNKNRNLVGLNRETCIITTHTQLRADCPIDANMGSISNLTVIADATDAQVTEEQADINTRAYAIHIDIKATSPQPLTIRNCRLVSAWVAAIGIGARYYDDITVENCILETGETVTEQGALVIHNDDFYPNTSGGKVKIKDCVVHGNHNYAAYILSVNNNNKLDVLFINNTMWVGDDDVIDIIHLTTPTSSGMLSGEDIGLHKASHSNNIAILNA